MASVNYGWYLEMHNYNFPVDFKLLLGDNLRFGLRYAYGRYTTSAENRNFLPSKNTTHTFGIQCDVYLNRDNALKFYTSPGLSLMFLTSDGLNPFYVGFETPYQIRSSWNGKSLNLDFGVLYEIPKSRFSVEGNLGLRVGSLTLDKMYFGNQEVIGKNNFARINAIGGVFEIGICYMFHQKKKPISEKTP
jgi:hypothetical protein